MASVQRRPNGKWRARYRDDVGKEHARHFTTRTAARHWLDEKTAQKVTGTLTDPKGGQTTLRVYFAEWSARQVWAAGTTTAMSLAVRTCSFADVALARITRSHVETWIKSMSSAGLAPGTIRTRTNNVRSVLRAAVRDRAIARDPSDGVQTPRLRRNDAAMTIPTPQQVQALLGAAEPTVHTYLALAAFAGLRLGEISALQVGDVDFLRRQLTVRRQVQRAGAGQIAISPPKWGSERTVFLADELVQLLARHVEEIGVRGEEGWLFVGQHADPPHQNTVGYWWRRTAAAARVGGFTLHDLRHFYASGLIAAGCDVVTVQRALGHAKATTTLGTYSHLWPTAEDRTRAAAGELMIATSQKEISDVGTALRG